jgi:hypothetical protein
MKAKDVFKLLKKPGNTPKIGKDGKIKQPSKRSTSKKRK